MWHPQGGAKPKHVRRKTAMIRKKTKKEPKLSKEYLRRRFIQVALFPPPSFPEGKEKSGSLILNPIPNTP